MARSTVSRSGVSTDDEFVLICPSMVTAVVLPSRANADGTGLGEVTCHGSTVKGHTSLEADKLLIRPEQVGQAGAGNPKGHVKRKTHPRAASILESHPESPTPA